MARITMTIDADDSTDLVLTLRELVSVSTLRQMVEDGEVDPVREDEPEVEPEAGEPVRRTRRTRAQIEADNATQAAAGANSTSGSATDASSGSLAATPGPNGSSQPSEGGPNNDPFASPPTSAVSQASLADEKTQKDVRDAMAAYLNGEGHDAKEIKVILATFKTAAGAAVEAASGLRASDYAAFIEKLGA